MICCLSPAPKVRIILEEELKGSFYLNFCGYKKKKKKTFKTFLRVCFSSQEVIYLPSDCFSVTGICNLEKDYSTSQNW